MTSSIVRVVFALVAAAAVAGCKRDGGHEDSAAKTAARPGGAAAAKPGATAATSGAKRGAEDGSNPAQFENATSSEEARDHFRRGMIALHSFWYDEASTQFEAAIAADRGFAMAYWGLAMSKSKLLWGDDDLAGGRRALSLMPPSSGLPAREKMWVAAVRALFGDGNVHSSRLAFAAAMEKIYATYPDDESTTFLAVALLATTRAEDPAGDPIRARAAQLAQSVYRRNPEHPGAAHYLIHAWDTPASAHLALKMARTFAANAPEAFHARHMPAHIFGRLGLWKEAVASCQSAWDASVTWAKRSKLSADHHDYHSLNWIIEMSFERGRRADADAAMAIFSDAVKQGLTRQNRTGYAKQVVSYLVRTGEWKRVDELLAPLGSPATDETPGGSGAGTCAAHAAQPPQSSQPPFELLERRAVVNVRVRAAAMRRDPALTRRMLAERAEVDRLLTPFYVSAQGQAYVTKLDQDRAVSDAAMMARARGDDRALLEPLGKLAEAAKAEFAAEGTAGGVLAPEEVADALLRLRRPADALAAYQSVLAQHQGRAHSLLGGARAATQAGDAATARSLYQQLLEVWTEADKDTPGLAEARKAVAGG